MYSLQISPRVLIGLTNDESIFPSRPPLGAAVAQWLWYRIMAGMYEFEPSTTKTRRVGERYTIHLSRAQTSSLGVVWYLEEGEGASSGVNLVT
ncbi:hypothetical protein TNCV_4584111 [Trichonephila clavipes]|nr:hypothetical protein TNCV_4584111 [Trichonephila clavipes]